jgi:Spy/CpxP family protein refolding chaperone
MNSIRNSVMILALLSSPAYVSAQAPPMFPWWDSPLARNIGLGDEQMRQVRAVVRESRGHLMELRSAVQNAEVELSDELSADPVDNRRASQAIEKVVNARAELTRTLAQMSLKLRLVLTPDQWKQLEKIRPPRGGGPQGRPGMRRGLQP